MSDGTAGDQEEMSEATGLSSGLSCFVCGGSNAKEEDWVWYDGKIRHICSIGCRIIMGDKLNENPRKTYLAHLERKAR